MAKINNYRIHEIKIIYICKIAYIYTVNFIYVYNFHKCISKVIYRLLLSVVYYSIVSALYCIRPMFNYFSYDFKRFQHKFENQTSGILFRRYNSKEKTTMYTTYLNGHAELTYSGSLQKRQGHRGRGRSIKLFSG